MRHDALRCSNRCHVVFFFSRVVYSSILYWTNILSFDRADMLREVEDTVELDDIDQVFVFLFRDTVIGIL